MGKTYKLFYRSAYRIVLRLFKKIPWLNRLYPTLPSGIEHSVKNYMQRQGLFDSGYVSVYEPEPQEPTNFELGDNREFSKYSGLSFPEVFIAEIPRAVVMVEGGIAIEQQTKKLLAESYRFFPSVWHIDSYPFFDSIKKFDLTRLPGPAAYFDSSDNFYHWHCETLPRILLFHRLHPGIPIYSNGFRTRWQQQAAGFFNIDYVHSLPENSSPYLLIEPYYFVSWPYLEFPTIHRKMLEFIRQHIREKAPETTATAPVGKRVYISRRKAAHRHVINEEALQRLLEDRYGFSCICMEDYSVPEQYRIFSEAQTIISVHGPALTLSLACSQAIIIELGNERHLISCYYRLANRSQNTYVLLKCRSVGDPVHQEETDFYGFADIEVDTARLESLLKSLAVS